MLLYHCILWLSYGVINNEWMNNNNNIRTVTSKIVRHSVNSAYSRTIKAILIGNCHACENEWMLLFRPMLAVLYDMLLICRLRSYSDDRRQHLSQRKQTTTATCNHVALRRPCDAPLLSHNTFSRMPSVRLLTLAWRDISVITWDISMKLAANVHCVSEHCWKSFQGHWAKGQRHTCTNVWMLWWRITCFVLQSVGFLPFSHYQAYRALLVLSPVRQQCCVKRVLL